MTTLYIIQNYFEPNQILGLQDGCLLISEKRAGALWALSKKKTRMQLTYMRMVRAGPFKRIVRKAKIFAMAKGFRGRRKNCYSLAVRSVHKALQRQYIGRKLKKRDMRKFMIIVCKDVDNNVKLWIQRINFGAREHNIGYSYFMAQMHRNNVMLNRKILSEFAIHEPRTFQALAQLAKDKQNDGLLSALN